MKRVILALVLVVASLFIISCNNERTLQEGEYWLTVVDEYDMLYEIPKDRYKAGEKVIIKTYLVADAGVYVYINGYDAKNNGMVRDEGDNDLHVYIEWEFTMPSKNSVLTIGEGGGFGVGVNMLLIDQSDLVINKVYNTQTAGMTCNLHTLTKDVKITVNTTTLSDEPTPICDVNGEVLYYEWSIKIPYQDINVWVEPILK